MLDKKQRDEKTIEHPLITDDNLHVIIRDIILAGTLSSFIRKCVKRFNKLIIWEIMIWYWFSFNSGTTTTFCTLYGFLAVMANHPEIQQNIQKEIDEVIGHNQSATRYHTKMPYTEASIWELLRYMSVTPFLMPHKATTNSQIAGYYIPKGSQVTFL